MASETQDRMLSVIEDLGYAINRAAHSIRSRVKNLVGLIMLNIAYPFTVEVMQGVSNPLSLF